MAGLRDAFPEVLKGIKTAQLAQEMLIYKEDYISEIGQTGEARQQEKRCSLCFMQPCHDLHGVSKITLQHPNLQGTKS